MAGSSTSTGTQQQTATTQTNPWAPQAGALKSIFGDAGNAYNIASQAQDPTQFTAGMTPDQMNTFQAMINYGMNNGTAAGQQSTGTANQNMGTAATGGALNTLANYNPAATNNTGADVAGGQQYAAGENIPAQVQAAMLAGNQEANQVTIPGMEQGAAGSGNINSSRTGISEGLVQQGLAEQAGALSAQLQGQAYNTGAGLTSNQNTANNAGVLSAATNEGNIGQSAVNSGVNAGTAGVTNQGALYGDAATGGAGEQANNQLADQNALQQYQFQTQSPFDALNNYYGIIGANNWGGTSTTNSSGSTSSTPSLLSTVGGLLGASGSAIGSKPGAFGGGSGILGMAAGM